MSGAGGWQRGAAGPAGGGAVGGRPVVGAAEQVALPQAELVAGQELAAAGGAAEALQVVDVVPGAHHQVAAAEGRPALGALDAKKPAGTRTRRQGRRPRRRGGSWRQAAAESRVFVREKFGGVKGLSRSFGVWFSFVTSAGARGVTCCNPACSRPCRRAGSMCTSRPGAARTRRT